MAKTVLSPLIIKENEETPNDYIQYFVGGNGKKRIIKFKFLIVEYPNGKVIEEELIWLPEYDYDEETKIVKQSIIPFVKITSNEQFFISRLDNFKRVAFKKTK